MYCSYNITVVYQNNFLLIKDKNLKFNFSFPNALIYFLQIEKLNTHFTCFIDGATEIRKGVIDPILLLFILLREI